MEQLLAFVLIHLYSGSLNAGRICCGPLLGVLRRKKNWHLRERFTVAGAPSGRQAGGIQWIHAASLGEAKLLCSFLALLREKYPADRYLVSATTATGVDYLRAHAPECVESVRFLPVDTIGLMKRMVTVYRVRRVWIMETELWPSMLWVCMKKRIPVGIVNGRIEAASARRYRLLRPLLAPLLAWCDPVFVQSENHARRFRELGAQADAVVPTGNFKSHISVGRPAHEDWAGIRRDMNIDENDCVFTCGCLREKEGTVIARTLELLKSGGLGCKCIIVPRHPAEVASIKAELGNGALHVTQTRIESPWEVCIVEKFGVLDDMYRIADCAFVGGTFVAIGGHNVWDAARYGIPVFFGPDYHTQYESAERLIHSGVGFCARSAEDLARQIIHVCKEHPREFITAQVKFKNKINTQRPILHELIPADMATS